MEPGTILLDQPPEPAVAAFLADEDRAVTTLFESLAGGDGAAFRAATACFRASVAAMSAALGAPDLTPTRRQGAAGAPRIVDAAWTRMALWRREDQTLYATLAGAPGKAARVELARDARKRAG